MRTLMTVLLLFSITSLGSTATLYVPSQYSNIKDAIGAASDGDTILVSASVYTERLDFLGKKLDLVSVDGPEYTFIKANALGSVIIIPAAIGSPLVDGFTITDGLADQGGGIYCPDSEPIIRNCHIIENATNDGSWPADGGDGGGIYCGTATIEDCIISQNTTGSAAMGNLGRGGHGGGIFIASGSPVIRNCTLSHNVTGNGSGIMYVDGQPGGSGAGIYSTAGARPTISLCTLSGNVTGKGGSGNSGYQGGKGGDGAGVYCLNGEMESCRIHGNQAGDGGTAWGISVTGDGGEGGGVYTQSMTLVNCEISGNAAGNRGSGFAGAGDPGMGGGVYFIGTGRLVNCTIVDNQSGNPSEVQGGGAFGNDLEIENSILWNNSPDHVSGTGVTIDSSAVEGGYAGTGNITDDPLFANAAGDDYHLTSTSPCINRGINLIQRGQNLDIDGDLRPYMGTDEFVDSHPLEADVVTLSASQGGSIHFTIDAGTTHALRGYGFLGSGTGTTPGFLLPGGMKLRIEWDGITDLVLEYWNSVFFDEFFGALDANGQATPTFMVNQLQPIWIGSSIYFAGTLYKPYDFVTNPVAIEIVP